MIATSGGALVALNLGLEYPEKINLAYNFEDEYPLPSYINPIKADGERDKRKLLAKLYWFYCHGFGWKKQLTQILTLILSSTKQENHFSKNQ